MNSNRQQKKDNKAPEYLSADYFMKLSDNFLKLSHQRYSAIQDLKLSKNAAIQLDQKLHSFMANFGSFSPGSIATAYWDWIVHLTLSPSKQLELIESARTKSLLLCEFLISGNQKSKKNGSLLSKDSRFESAAWKSWPYSVYKQAFSLSEQWWTEATSDVRGVTQHHSDILPFLTRQALDVFCPANFPLMNPLVVEKTIEEGGKNFFAGAQNFWEDLDRMIRNKPPVGSEKFVVGKNIAITPGKVIFQNELIELIQYSPMTKEVYAEPLLIIPAWIMKYYLMDLSPENSLVKYLVSRGHTVFMISWKNPDSRDQDLGFDSYLKMGIFDALDAVSTIVPKQKIHAVGYCLGGTLLSIAAALMVRLRDSRLKTITTFASQVDFEEAGEIQNFVDESQLNFLDDIMSDKGYLDARRISGTFYMLRSRDLIWSQMTNRYLLGERKDLTDLMAWNADSTRLPRKMLSEYLSKLYLNDDLVSGRFKALGKSISLKDIKTPIFAVSTEKDHIAPWQSVYKIHLFIESEITFVLTSGGHNGGIISEPGHRKMHYQIATHRETDFHLTPEEWQEITSYRSGSWWPAWRQWLINHSTRKISPPSMGCEDYMPLRNAPGEYILIN